MRIDVYSAAFDHVVDWTEFLDNWLQFVELALLEVSFKLQHQVNVVKSVVWSSSAHPVAQIICAHQLFNLDRMNFQIRSLLQVGLQCVHFAGR